MGLGIAPIPFLIYTTMVYINSFDFNNEYNQINADVSLPPYELTSEVYIDTVIIGS